MNDMDNLHIDSTGTGRLGYLTDSGHYYTSVILVKFHAGDWEKLCFHNRDHFSPQIKELTHWGRDKMAAIFQTTFSNAFSWMKMHEFCLRFHWTLLLRVKLTIFHHRFRKWLGADQATSHFFDRWWPCLLTHICVTRPQWVKNNSISTENLELSCNQMCPYWQHCR